MKISSNNGKRTAVQAAGLLLLSFFIQSTYSLYVSGIDHYLIACVTNGIYSVDNYCLFVSPILCWLVKVLGRVFPAADNYTLLILIFMSIALYWLYFVILTTLKNRKCRVITVLIIFCIVFASNDGMTMRFTVQAGFLMFVGLFSVVLIPFVQRKTAYGVMGWLCCTFGILIRKEAALVMLPYAALIILGTFVKADRDRRKEYAKNVVFAVLPVAIIIGGLFLIQYRVDNSAYYREATVYNNARSNLVDYPQRTNEELQNLIPEVSENDAEAVKTLMLADTEIENPEYIQSISDVSRITFIEEQNMTSLTSIGIYAVVHSVWQLLFSPAGLLCVILLTAMFFFLPGWINKAMAFCTGAGTVVILGYFMMIQGRTYGIHGLVSVGAFLVIFYLMLTEQESFLQRAAENKVLFPILLTVILYLNLPLIVQGAVFPPQFSGIRPEWHPVTRVFHAKADDDRIETTLSGYLDGNDIYIWNVREFDAKLEEWQKCDKLPSEQLMMHHLPAGEWTYGQVYFTQYLSRLEIDNPLKALLDREHTYYVGSNAELVYEWIREHYDPAVIQTQKGTIQGIPVVEFKIP